ncbi:MAG: precorrin-3B C(17)-methyltransferase [Methyloligellaceae bacterium]
MSGSLIVAGLGPGSDQLITPEVSSAISAASDIVGYIPYVKRIPPREGLTLHASDNRVEIDRAKHALTMASDGKNVVVVSSGDPGVFAMAAAIFEAIEEGPDHWRFLDIQILPGITAMLAAAAKAGAPLGHDFCAINLSDNLKPWELVAERLKLAAKADFAIALYNPRSKARPDQLFRTFDILKEECKEDRIVIFARAVSTPEETLTYTSLQTADAGLVDMRTVVIIGSSRTRRIDGTDLVYTPRKII